jgi:RNAse (barnase) inhibitor barstar
MINLLKLLPGLRGRSIHVINTAKAAEVVQKLKGSGFSLHMLAGDRAKDKLTFLAAAADAFDFPPKFGLNWDAFIDSFADFLERVPMPAAVVWTRADILVKNDLQSFIEVITTFDSAAVERELSAEDDEKVQVEFFVLIGDGPDEISEGE